MGLSPSIIDAQTLLPSINHPLITADKSANQFPCIAGSVDVMSFIVKNYLKCRLGARDSGVLLDALHASPESHRPELFTDAIVAGVSSEMGCHCIIATVPREIADLNQFPNKMNREAVQEYRQTIGGILLESEALDENNQLRFPFLHLSLHGMRDRPQKDIELGTCFGESCSEELLQWLLEHFRKWATNLRNCRREPKIVVNDANDALFGHPVIATHRWGDKSSEYAGYGPKFNTVQIELAHWLRTEHTEDLVNLFVSVAQEFCTHIDRDIP